MGDGPTLIAFDGHIDTVGVGNINNWNFDPFEGMEDDEVVGGRGGSDQLGGVVSAVYGGAVARDLGLLSDKYTYMVTGTVQEAVSYTHLDVYKRQGVGRMGHPRCGRKVRGGRRATAW